MPLVFEINRNNSTDDALVGDLISSNTNLAFPSEPDLGKNENVVVDIYNVDKDDRSRDIRRVVLLIHQLFTFYLRHGSYIWVWFNVHLPEKHAFCWKRITQPLRFVHYPRCGITICPKFSLGESMQMNHALMNGTVEDKIEAIFQ